MSYTKILCKPFYLVLLDNNISQQHLPNHLKHKTEYHPIVYLKNDLKPQIIILPSQPTTIKPQKTGVEFQPNSFQPQRTIPPSEINNHQRPIPPFQSINYQTAMNYPHHPNRTTIKHKKNYPSSRANNNQTKKTLSSFL
jgi:hypothetical protein